MSIEIKLEQPEKAFFPMLVTLSEIFTDVKPVHFWYLYLIITQ